MVSKRTIFLLCFLLIIPITPSGDIGTEEEIRYSSEIKPRFVFTWDVTNFTKDNVEVTSIDSYFPGIKNGSVIRMETDVNPSELNLLNIPGGYNTSFLLGDLFNITIDGEEIPLSTNTTMLLDILMSPNYIKYDNGTEISYLESEKPFIDVQSFWTALNLSGSFGWSFDQHFGFRKELEINSYGPSSVP